MSNENNETFEKLEKQIGTLKFVVLIMAAALIYNSAVKTGMLGDYRITANTLAIKTMIHHVQVFYLIELLCYNMLEHNLNLL